MRALVLNGAYNFSYEERKKPERKKGEVLIRIRYVSICGSDIHAIRGNQPLFTFPRVIGHEISATVEEADAASSLKKGDLVCVMPCIACGTCIACCGGKTNCCTSLKLYGVHEDGGLEEYLSLPERFLIKVPFQDKAEEAALIEPLTIGYHAVSRMHLDAGGSAEEGQGSGGVRKRSLLVLGAGPIGAACAVTARAKGLRAALADINPKRRAFVESTFGFPVFDPVSEDGKRQIKEFAAGEGFHGVIDTTANPTSMEHAYEWLGHGGELVFVGMFKGTLNIDEAAFHMKEPSLHVTRNSVPDDYAAVLRLWEEGKLDPGLFITDRVDFSHASERITEWAEGKREVFKGVVKV